VVPAGRAVIMDDVTTPAAVGGGGASTSAIAARASRRQSLAVLRYAGFRRLFLAQTVNLLGSAIAPIALAFAVLGQPGGSATDLGLILAARALGQVAFLLSGGVLADRMPRLRLMTAAASCRRSSCWRRPRRYG